jgi:hypothetical protein
MTEDVIRAKIEGLMGWKRGASNSFSFRALQSFVRGKDPEFDRELALYLDKGEHIFVERLCPHGKKAGECDACDVLSDLAYDTARENSRKDF